MLTKILIGVVALIIVFLIVAALQPAHFQVARSMTIAAPPAAVFAHVNELRRWEAWNPWGKLDPNMKLSYTGPTAGPGASYAWEGNNQVGAGKLTVTESRPAEFVRVQLDFLKPFPGTNTGEFTFAPEGENTRVTWSMSGKRNFIMKAAGLLMSMDRMIGTQFEKGLGDLKQVVESVAASRPPTP